MKRRFLIPLMAFCLMIFELGCDDDSGNEMVDSGTQISFDGEADSNSDSDSDASIDANLDAETQADTAIAADVETKTDTSTSTDAEADVSIDAETDADANISVDASINADVDASADAKSDSDSGTESLPKAGNPDGKCSQPLPIEAQPVDTSQPTTVVGSGDPASCTHQNLATAIAEGGVITFNCGQSHHTISVTATLELPTDRDTVIDGGNKITLDGGSKVRILRWNSGDWQSNQHMLTLQHIVLANGKATGTELIPERPEPCSQGYNDGEGGALFMRDGALHAIDVIFINNQAAELGPDTGGGAVYLLGTRPAYIASCTFKDNKASNAGAIGSLFAENFIYDSLFEGNSATGHGANNDDATQCDYINNGQHQIGSGGNGGAIYNDGVGMNVTICGIQVRHNTAGAFGAAVFFTSNDPSNKGTLSIRESLMFDNLPANEYWEWQPGISTNANTPDPINSDISR